MLYFIGPDRLIESYSVYKKATIQDCKVFLKEYCLDTGLDCETEGLFNHNNKIVMLQLSNGKDSFVIDARSTNLLEIKEELETKTYILQNGKFDYKFLKFYGIELNSVVDTFLNECILTNGLESKDLGITRELNLKALAKKYCDKVLNKDTRLEFTKLAGKPFTDKQIIYGCEDTECLPEIANKQLIELQKLNLTEWANLEYKATLALGDIEYNGLGFNSSRWLEMAKTNAIKIPIYEEELNNMVVKEPKLSKFIKKSLQIDIFNKTENPVNISWSSPTQIVKVLKTLGLPLESSSEKEIAKYQDDYPIVKKFIDYKKDAKLVSTYGEDFLRFINPYSKRIHGDFWQILDTARVSCGGSKTNNKTAVNLQNLPAKNEYLNCFIARKGWKIVGIDYSGQEGRIAAYGSKDDIWMGTFLSGKDLHSEIAKMMFGITDELVRTKPDFLRGKSYRDVAKTINFGCLFGMSKFKLSKSLQIEIDEAEKLLIKYFQATKQLKSYLDACAAYGLKNGYIRSYKPFSGIRYFPQWKPNLDKKDDFKIIGEITRASYNTPVQMSGALMTKLALTKVREYINNNSLKDKVKLVHVVHDAIYTEVIEEFAEEWSNIQASLMQEAGRAFTDKIVFETDISIENYWTK